MSLSSLRSTSLVNLPTFLVDKIQRFFPDEDLARVNSKIVTIRKGIGIMSSSAPSLYTSTPDPSSFPFPFRSLTKSKEIMQGVNEMQVQVFGEATYTFPILSKAPVFFGRPEILCISNINEYMVSQEAFTSRPEIIQFLLSALLISNYACRILGVVFTPVVFISAVLLRIKCPKIMGWVYALMLLHGFILGPILRQLIERISEPTLSHPEMASLEAKIEKANEAIRKIEECENDLTSMSFQGFTQEGLKKFLEARRKNIDVLDAFLKNAFSQVNKQDTLWKIKASLKERNWWL